MRPRPGFIRQPVVEDAIVFVAIVPLSHADMLLQLTVPCKHGVAATKRVRDIPVPRGLGKECTILLHVLV